MWMLICVSTGVILCTWAVFKVAKKHEQWVHSDEYRRKQICNFDEVITESVFDTIAKYELKYLSRLDYYEISGPKVYVCVYSQSGASSWKFCLDYNDFGRVSGEYWVYSENHKSSIPETIGNRIKRDIEKCKTGELIIENLAEKKENKGAIKRFCPYCGQRLVQRPRNFCEYCGNPI